MSTETETAQSAPDSSTISVATTESGRGPAAPAHRPLWRRRRYQVGATVLAVALFVSAIGFNMLARQYTPEGAVRGYLTALQSGDASAAWGEIQVTAATGPATASFTDRSAMQAALAAGKPDIRSFSIGGTTRVDAVTSNVGFSYETSAGTKQANFIVQQGSEKRFGLYPLWHIEIVPTLLQISLPKGSAGVAIDGRPLALAEGKSTIAVLPLVHKLRFNGTQILAAQTLTVDAFFSLGQPVNYQPQLTTFGMERAKVAVKAALDNCTKLPSSRPENCPQSVTSAIFVDSGRWQLVGDPTQDMAIAFDTNFNTVATGHYQMVFAYQEAGYQSVQHSPVGGGYSVNLVLAATDVAVGSLQRADGLPAIERPAGATDQAAKDLVVSAFKQCAAAQVQAVADCPQAIGNADVSAIRWTLNGDPLAGATVSFDQNIGVLRVHGNFDMAASFTSFGTHQDSKSFVTAYDAYLFWDGQNLQLVTIAGSTS